MDVIDSFDGDYRFLSNYFPVQITYDGLTYKSAEAAFQASKCESIEQRRQFTSLDPAQSKRLGRNVQLRSDWESVKDSIMEDIIRIKFSEYPYLRAQLIETGNAELIDGNTWGDKYWGVDKYSGYGQNKLGIILMNVRKELACSK